MKIASNQSFWVYEHADSVEKRSVIFCFGIKSEESNEEIPEWVKKVKYNTNGEKSE
jgi:IS1 family transposase